ncbi:hypothetical protein [Bradyrhizobium sp.]|uniref:hypothetical protein n=1 Tax=Bradyrhizobium sp. TaxID=376 RepID=UPI002628F285|nr:hypothetical protein [Bradyrhizobium sp.]
MSRQHKLLPIRIALSPTQCASATGLHFENVIKPAVESGALRVHLIGDGVRPKRRVIVADLEQWLRDHPQLIKHVTKRSR